MFIVSCEYHVVSCSFMMFPMLYLNVDVVKHVYSMTTSPKRSYIYLFFFKCLRGGVSYISKNNVPKCKLHFGEVPKNVSYIYRGPPPIS